MNATKERNQRMQPKNATKERDKRTQLKKATAGSVGALAPAQPPARWFLDDALPTPPTPPPTPNPNPTQPIPRSPSPTRATLRPIVLRQTGLSPLHLTPSPTIHLPKLTTPTPPTPPLSHPPILSRQVDQAQQHCSRLLELGGTDRDAAKALLRDIRSQQQHAAGA